MSIQQLRQLFAMESQDTLQQMEDSLLLLEKNPNDQEAIKRAFRSVHTIKGSAGVVGLDSLSSFAHTVENVLDKVRSGSLHVSAELIRLLLSCRDHLELALEQSAEQESGEPDEETKAAGQALSVQLQDWAAGKTSDANAQAVPPAKEAKEAGAVAGENVKSDKLILAFTEESRETLQEMAAALEELKSDPTKTDALDILFRTVHTLRSSTNLIGLKAASDFLQTLQHIVDKYHDGKLCKSGNFVQLMLSCQNHLSKWLPYACQHPRESAEEENTGFPADARVLLAQLNALPEADAETAPTTGMPAGSQASPVTVGEGKAVEDTNWHISLRFFPDALRTGMEPLACIRYLATLGEILHLNTLFDTMPAAAEMDPENCYLGFEIKFRGDADKQTLEEAFDLVRDQCRVRILPPHSRLSHYIQLIQELPEDTSRLGEILIESGTLTKVELKEGLEQQQAGFEKAAMDGGKVDRIGEILVDSGVVEQDVVNAALDKQRQVQESRALAQKILHVDAKKLDQLIDLVGELVIANAGMHLLVQDSKNERLKETASMMSRLVEDIRNSTLSMRMVQIGSTFNRFRRLVHDISHTLNKEIDLIISGAEAELDKSMVEKINDPLMHLVRNAIDHGIEPKEVRAARGKPATGTLHLNAYHDSGSIVIEVGDDGSGLNRQEVLNAAVAKGMIKSDQDLTEQEIDNLIFEPDLSTAKEVTQLSGRGVGLDVVKRNINSLNGTVNILSEEGQGTTMQIYLPLTLAIIDGFLLSVGKSSFVVPLDRVVECVEYSKESQTQAGYLNLRGKVLPLLHVRRLFEMEEEDVSVIRENIVVVHYGCQQAGLVVDELQGEFQAVIKPLGKVFERLPGVSGATILGNGEVALILDIPELVQKYTKQNLGCGSQRIGKLENHSLALH
ncbi:MAG: chemotaxis protein CheA [Gammaproteobacteria bacterium]|nr:chemotaxis protein CheA [Gammaproteobacteria bacterium]